MCFFPLFCSCCVWRLEFTYDGLLLRPRGQRAEIICTKMGSYVVQSVPNKESGERPWAIVSNEALLGWTAQLPGGPRHAGLRRTGRITMPRHRSLLRRENENALLAGPSRALVPLLRRLLCQSKAALLEAFVHTHKNNAHEVLINGP
jgi:hypothetical protein